MECRKKISNNCYIYKFNNILNSEVHKVHLEPFKLKDILMSWQQLNGMRKKRTIAKMRTSKRARSQLIKYNVPNSTFLYIEKK